MDGRKAMKNLMLESEISEAVKSYQVVNWDQNTIRTEKRGVLYSASKGDAFRFFKKGYF